MRIAAGCVLWGLAGCALAQGVTISGTNTLRIERYDTDGAVASSPFPFTTSTGYDELVLNLAYQPSSFDRWQGLFAGVANDSRYRSADRGFVPERMLLARENGEAAIPYRLEAGDFFAFTSLRTQQRPLKGVAVELQPVHADAGLRSSLLLFGGAFQPTWRHYQWSEDNSLGLSWLVETGGARFTLNALRNERGANAAFATPDLSQSVASIAAEVPFRLGASAWRAEAEVAMLRGDSGVAVPTQDGDGGNSGVFAQLSGTLATTPLAWRLRGERYGRDYRPFGSAVPSDRRAAEAHVSWQSPQALLWRARLQDYRDGLESGNPLDTQVIGAAVSGPIAPWNATMSVDVFRQDLERTDGTLDQRLLTANAFLSRGFGPLAAQLGLLYQRVEDHLAAGASPRTRQVSLSVAAPLRFGDVTGSISPGLTWREITGAPSATRDVGATLQLALFGGPHRLSLNAGRVSQDPSLAPSPEVATVNFGLDYRYRWGRHELGADIVVFDRKPRPGEKTEAYRAGISWVYAFDHVPAAAMPPTGAASIASAATGPVPRDAGLLGAIAPGDPLDATLTRLSASGVSGGTRLPGAVVFEARLLREVDERQRVALVHAGGLVDRAALLVSLAPSAGPQDAERTYDAVRRALIERYGRPASTFEEGTFAPGYAGLIATGRLVRIAEWKTDRGTLRLGIPRRTDGAVRIEIHHARTFPGPRDPGWGLDSLR